jgi:hypothetical protein
MIGFEISSVGWLLASIQTAGLLSALLARLGERSAFQTLCQGLFLVCLCLVGAGTVCSLSLGPGQCLLSGSTLALMSVAAVYDTRPTENLEAF